MLMKGCEMLGETLSVPPALIRSVSAAVLDMWPRSKGCVKRHVCSIYVVYIYFFICYCSLVTMSKDSGVWQYSQFADERKVISEADWKLGISAGTWRELYVCILLIDQ